MMNRYGRNISVANTGTIEDEAVRDAAEFNRALLWGLALVAGIALVGAFFVVSHFLVEKYMAPFHQQKSSVTFGERERERLIDDEGQVTTFRTAIISAQEVESYHTYPIDKIRFYFPDEASNTYFLGRDSEIADEFWLEVGGPLGPIYLKQFRSEALAEWLTRNGVR
jgi:hypothetical protein